MLLKVDFIGKVKQLDCDFNVLCNRMHIIFNQINRLNDPTSRKKVVGSEIANYIYTHYKQNFDLFR